METETSIKPGYVLMSSRNTVTKVSQNLTLYFFHEQLFSIYQFQCL